MSIEHPADDVHVVNVLFNDVVAAKPFEEVPVADFVVHLCRPLASLAATILPKITLVPRGMRHYNCAESAFLNELLAGAISLAVVPLQANDYSEILFARLIALFHNFVASRHIDGERLFSKDVLLGSHCSPEVLGPKTRRRSEQYGINV